MAAEEAAGAKEILQPVRPVKPEFGRTKGPILTTRNVTLVSYKLDETTSSEDTQAAILTDLYTRFRNTPGFKSYDEINKAIIEGEVAVGTFVLFSDESEEVKIVVAKIRATRQK
jgi:predicted solute-binding protein